MDWKSYQKQKNVTVNRWEHPCGPSRANRSTVPWGQVALKLMSALASRMFWLWEEVDSWRLSSYMSTVDSFLSKCLQPTSLSMSRYGIKAFNTESDQRMQQARKNNQTASQNGSEVRPSTSFADSRSDATFQLAPHTHWQLLYKRLQKLLI